MNTVIKVINRVIVVEFYKQNAAFFALIFLVFFGFIKHSEHMAIGLFLVSNPSTLIFLFVLCLAYAAKVVLFVLPAINKSENSFLEAFYLLPSRIKTFSSIVIVFFLLLPIAAYITFLLLLALLQLFYLSALILVFSLFIFTMVISRLLCLNLNKLPHEKSFFQFQIFKKVPKPSVLFFITYILRKEIVLLMLTKLYTCTLIYGTALLYKTDQFDLQLLTTGVLLGFVGNVALVQKYVWFQYHEMAFYRNLPARFFEVFARHIFIFIILLIPELITLVRHYPIDPEFLDLFGIILFGISNLTLIYSLLLIKNGELSQFMTTFFWVVVLSTFLILFSMHPLALAALFLIISITIFYFRQYKFEYSEG